MASLNDLLKVSIKYSDPEELKRMAADAAYNPDPTKVKQLSAEDREILDSVMETDVVRMKRVLEKLRKDESSFEDLVQSLEELQYYVENIDNACDLWKIGGVPTVMSLLDSASDDVVVHSAWVLATALQHNPFLQQQMLSTDIMPKLLDLIRSHTSAAVRAKALLAISALVRHNPEGLRLFLGFNGVANLSLLLDEKQDTAVLAKALSLSTSLIREDPNLAASIPIPPTLRRLVPIFASDDLPLKHALLDFLTTCVECCPASIEHIRLADATPLLQQWFSTIQSEDDPELHQQIAYLLSAIQ